MHHLPDGRPARNSPAEGPIVFDFSSHVRSRKLSHGSTVMILEWFNGTEWLEVWRTDEMSNDLAYSEMKSKGIYYAKLWR